MIQNHRISPENIEETDGEVRMRFPVASDTPVERRGFYEVLSHEPGAMSIGERQTSMPLLFNHDMNRLIGVVEKIDQDNHRTYATVRFSKTEEGQKALQMVKEKVLVNVSARYCVRDAEVLDDDTLVVTSWELMEVSLVTIPADPTVGVYRNLNHLGANMPQEIKKNEQPEAKQPAEIAKEAKEQVRSMAVEEARSLEIKEQKAREDERVRVAQIYTLCRDFGISEGIRDDLVSSGRSLIEARSAILDELKGRSAQPAASSGRGMSEDLGLTETEKRSYSVIRAINAMLTNDWSRAGFEREVSRSIAQVHKLENSSGFFMPSDLPSFSRASSVYKVGTPETGGNLVPTELKADSFIELLRNNSMVMRLGPTFLRGLRGNVEIPRQTDASTVFWIDEDGEPTLSNAKFEKVALKPKTVGALSNISRNLLMQSSIEMESFVRAELAKSMALGIDLAALCGSGASNQPLGIANTPKICSVVGGENGATLTFDHLIEMETLVANENADVRNMYYLCNAATIGFLKKIKDTTGNYIWKPVTEAVRNGIPGDVNGYPVARSNQVRKNLTKGTSTDCTEIFFGNWADLLIGEWGYLEIDANRYGEAWRSGGVEIKAMQSLDIAVRHPESFCVFSDARLS